MNRSIYVIPVTGGFDTVDDHRLLNHRIIFVNFTFIKNLFGKCGQ